MQNTKSKFLKVKSPDSDYTVIIFDKCDTVIKDPVGMAIVEPVTGSLITVSHLSKIITV
jgi:ribosomal protein S27E